MTPLYPNLYLIMSVKGIWIIDVDVFRYVRSSGISALEINMNNAWPNGSTIPLKVADQSGDNMGECPLFKSVKFLPVSVGLEVNREA